MPKIIGTHVFEHTYEGINGTTRVEYLSPIVELSTGRVVMVGRHSYCSMIDRDGNEVDRNDYVELTREEQDESWKSVEMFGDLRVKRVNGVRS